MRNRNRGQAFTPHILPLFDSGEADGTLFYVMPLVEGESLRERLEQVEEHQTVRADGSCDVLAIPNGLMKPPTHLAGILFAPIDFVEKHLSGPGGLPG